MVRLIQQPTGGTDLLEQYRQSGSPDLFAQIMRAYGGMVLSVCYKVTKDAADAEDASQATFLTLAVQCKTGAQIQYLGPWLKKVAKRTSLDLVRSRKRRTRRELVTAESRPEHYDVRPGAKPEADELHNAIRAELDELPPKYKMPLVLHYFGGLSHEQISKEMNCTTAALGVRLHRARKMLGQKLKAKGISLEGAALGAAVAVAIQHALLNRFFESPHAMALGLAPAYAAPMSASMSAGLPEHFASVLHVVHEVGHSMAKARVRMATAALAASISLLGGAAEAVRHLPESLRPNLEFLSPSRLLKNLFDGPALTPRLQLPVPVRTVADVDDDADAPAVPVYAAATPLNLSSAVNQPVLALLWPPPVSPPAAATPAYASPLSLTTAAVQRPTAPATLATTAAAAPVVGGRSRSSDGGLRPSSGGGSSAPASSDAAGASSSAGGSHRAGLSFGGSPGNDALGRGDDNVPHVTSVGGFSASAVGGATAGHIPPPPKLPGVTPGPAPLPTDDTAFTPDSVLLSHNEVFVHGGTGRYQWYDPTAGIARDGTNAVEFRLENASGPGLVTIEHLPVTTTLAPARPEGHTFVGIWSFDSAVQFSAIDLTAHYDDALAESLGLNQNWLKLWVYDDGQWTRLDGDPSFRRDLVNHTLYAAYAGTPEYFAVSCPEPATLGVFAAAGALLLRRRRLVPSPVSSRERGRAGKLFT